MIKLIRIPIIRCSEGIYLRWFFNGWHYFLFTNGYEVTMQTENADTMVTKKFSVISRIERATMITAKYSYTVGLEGVTKENIGAFTGVLMAEKVEQYENQAWHEVDIVRGAHPIKEEGAPGYIFEFVITRKELPGAVSVFQKTQFLYLGDQLCDMDDDEIIPINKQVNDIAEMKDRQSDFTGTFKIRKTRAMRLLFELSGESGSNTTLPYKKQPARIVQNGIEIVSGGKMTLNKNDDQYYYVSIYSGNINFFSVIETKKITELSLPSLNHTWNAATMAASNAADLDYVYPLLEPSDDGGMTPLTDNGSRVNLYGGWIWPFVKIKAIWDAIFLESGFTCSGDILTNDKFKKLFMPIASLSINKALIANYLYSAFRRGYMPITSNAIFGTGGTGRNNLIFGNAAFAEGNYSAPFTASYRIQVEITYLTATPTIYLYVNGSNTSEFTRKDGDATHGIYEIIYAATAGMVLSVWGNANTYFSITISVVEVLDAKIDFNSPIVPSYDLSSMTQINFLKMICNLFCLVPDVISRDKKIRFWNYQELYDNIPSARDWSDYLSETEDETEFQFGNYAQRNILKYEDSKDVIPDNGKGTMQIDDETLEMEKEMLTLPVSTCDEVRILGGEVNVSRITFNKYDAKLVAYKTEESIDPRIVYVSQLGSDKTFGISTGLTAGVPSGTITDTVSPRKASSIEISFSSMMPGYAPLSRMLTKTNLRKEKFNLPVYEVAGLKHYIPIYLRQFSAYFYVNKITNYVPGHLCTVEIVKL